MSNNGNGRKYSRWEEMSLIEALGMAVAALNWQVDQHPSCVDWQRDSQEAAKILAELARQLDRQRRIEEYPHLADVL